MPLQDKVTERAALREIVLDTETTGLDPNNGHRIVEIAAIELRDCIPSGRKFHVHLDPQRDMPEEAFRVHGLSAEFLTGKPRFENIADDFLTFIADGRLVIHNAEFDMRFLNAEFRRAGRDPLPQERALDTLALARRKFPGSSNSLDALCARFRIDASRRIKHSAIVDAEILAEVYLELIGGRQSALILFDLAAKSTSIKIAKPRARPTPLPPYIQQGELNAHRRFVEELGRAALWWRFMTDSIS